MNALDWAAFAVMCVPGTWLIIVEARVWWREKS